MILVCGEALIDLFVDAPAPPGPDPARAGSELAARAVAGGSPFNVAIGLARLGAASGFLGGLSADGFGRFLCERLRDEGVELGFVRHSERPTPLVVVAPSPDGHPAYTFHASDCAYQDVRPEHLPDALPPGGALVLGSFSIVQEPVGSTLLALAEREAGQRVISLDPNVRSALAGDPEAWRARFARFASLATIIKLSVEDLQLAYGEDADPQSWAQRWLDGGARLVVLTRGEDGATGYHRRGRVDVPGRRVAVIDTVGAGDTFHAALLARLQALGELTPEAVGALTAPALEALLRHAVLAASITCSRRGADMPRLAEIVAAQ